MPGWEVFSMGGVMNETIDHQRETKLLKIDWIEEPKYSAIDQVIEVIADCFQREAETYTISRTLPP